MEENELTSKVILGFAFIILFLQQCLSLSKLFTLLALILISFGIVFKDDSENISDIVKKIGALFLICLFSDCFFQWVELDIQTGQSFMKLLSDSLYQIVSGNGINWIFPVMWLFEVFHILVKDNKGVMSAILFIIGLLLLEPHLSASMVIIGIVCIMMIVAGCKFKHFALTGLGVGVPGLALLIAIEPYRLKRFVTFMDPWQDIRGDGWQVVQSLYAIGSGGLFGVGLGDSKQKYLYIPEPHNDFIFSILAEELGFVGCAVVLILFAVFIWRGVLIAMKAPDMFGSLIAIGITSLVAIQVIINVAVVTSSMPATGMPLPFFSYRWYGVIYIIVRDGCFAEYFSCRCERELGTFLKIPF